ncbi:fungal-specific transcription factor domain-containing protein [Tricharina praecox]|uniref:fungal-specific transcription factor domain-containing protein n=1 Tax=Tricharina praecox TaxID=43433 RepID=UPI00221F24A8|nr:fungal-specific transcription factor domain-containing protein [Tricharina praecox]KAI5852289.1 fungal-specific transcription factor domain-containing protein [Tricharina praecox]
MQEPNRGQQPLHSAAAPTASRTNASHAAEAMSNNPTGSSTGTGSVAGDALTAAHQASRKRRSFQSRRKERSCDSCKLRKTRCDARENEPCSACLAAKLSCTFSSPDHEGRKMGPTRRIRELERTVEELTRKLDLAEQRHRKYSAQDDGVSQDENYALASPMGSFSDSPSNTLHTGRGSSSRHGRPSSRISPGESDSGPQNRSSPAGSALASRRGYDWNYDSPPNGPTDSAQVTWNPNIFGPGSAPQFIDSYKQYLQRQGLYAQHISGEQANMYEKTEQVPLLSDVAGSRGGPELDLRVYLPARTLANRLLEAFRVTIQNYKPLFYWPILERKFERAWSSPMMEGDEQVVREVFCVVMTVLSVGAQLVKVEEMFPVGTGSQSISQERHGWKFFELARRYMNLNNPVYTLEDATVLLLMSLYLDKATLPSPCWMICGAMARVCQDIGLHRQPPVGKFTNVQLECRVRLFWVAYIQDKRISMKMGRPCILREEDCNIMYPGVMDSTGIGTALLCPQITDVPVGGLPKESPDVIHHKAVARRALETLTAAIGVCKVVEKILGHRFKTGESPDKQMHRMKQLKDELTEYWKTIPQDLANPQLTTALDLPSVRVVFIAQHARLILFRHFTDSNATRSFTPELLNYCLQESIEVSVTTARLLRRAKLHPAFNDDFGVVTDDLVHLHTFRVAVILLLALEMHSPAVSPDDLDVCLSTLQAIARVHITGRRYGRSPPHN